MNKNMKKKVIIGLSGGVDSSVAALLLKQKGYLVEAVFMKNWDSGLNFDIKGNPDIKELVCPQTKDYQDALKISQQLEIKLHKVDFVEEYWNKVFKYFLDSLKKNLTPNPDVLCNNEIKFNVFTKYVDTFKPDFIATGHYANIDYDKNNKLILKKAFDTNKDQSYFLSQLKQHQLKKIIFPLGNLTKPEVREIAKKAGLINANKKDSTGICFIGERRFFDFLKNYLPMKPGKMKKLDGTYLKEHRGTIYYTIGQRKGLGLGGCQFNQSPWFVVGKNLKKNILYVEQGSEHFYLYSDSALIVDVVWRGTIYDIQEQIKISKKNLNAKFRYRQLDQKISITWLNNTTVKVYYPQKIKAVTPGQICAFYLEDICLGSGMIKEVYSHNKKMIYV
ncbi:tRNA 2-thiouridine(34) synthase MnmA [Candidatus Phytoplasma mali]|nr:tRNA 2-thiouridine(34) synthase MnmA [Candidatus Phytoplasma mali]